MESRTTLRKMLGMSRSSKAWRIIAGYLDGDYNQMSMYVRLLDYYGGDRRMADADVWQVADWQTT